MKRSDSRERRPRRLAPLACAALAALALSLACVTTGPVPGALAQEGTLPAASASQEQPTPSSGQSTDAAPSDGADQVADGVDRAVAGVGDPAAGASAASGDADASGSPSGSDAAATSLGDAADAASVASAVSAGEDQGEGGSQAQDAAAQAPAVGLVYVESSSVEPGATQSIAVLFDGEPELAGATLDVAFPDGSVRTFDASRLADGAAGFTFAVPDAGTYSIVAGTVTLQGSSQALPIDLTVEQTGEACTFEAGSSDGTGDSAQAVSLLAVSAASGDASSEATTTASTQDASGNEVSTDSIADAIGTSLAATALSTSLASADSTGSSGKIVIVIDPGHGGIDPGASDNGLVESDLNWKISMACKARLEEDPRFEVILTRGENECPSIRERAQVAIDNDADLLLCLHNNEAESSSASGCMVFYPNETSTWYRDQTYAVGVDVAQRIEDKLEALGLNGNGIKTRLIYGEEGYLYPDGTGVSDYYGIIRYARQAGVPAVLVEHAFMSNPGDAALLSDDSFLTSLGVADAEAVIEYYSSVDGWRDVGASDWYVVEGVEDGQGYFQYAVSHGIVTGDTDAQGNPTHYFRPLDAVTREQAITMLYRIANPDSQATTDPSQYLADTDFNDDSAYAYSNAAIQWGKDNGILTGDTDAAGNPVGTFRPTEPVTREELAAMVTRFAEWKGVSVAADTSLLSSFPDAVDVSGFARSSMAWCVANGLITGDRAWDPAHLDPQGEAQRCQAVKILTVLSRDVLGN
ncbi:MAG: N-acetylmuramoyl-L-alanine amidase [Coriobacteriales bacterium]|jgi:N-acetylmuramoyl-L-alanine amidase